MGLWCKDLPFVTVERSSAWKPSLTLIVAYYENPSFLSDQLGHWAYYSEHLKEKLSIIVVDDCSPNSPAAAVVQRFGPGATRGVRVFRIEQDVKWNWLAARNIGAHEAQDGWLLLTDMDHVVPEYTLESCLYGELTGDTIYGFSRQEHDGKPLQPHQNSFLLTRSLYWKWGGYDETLSGRYGSNGDAVRRMAATAPMAILTDKLVRYEFVADSSTTQFKRKLPEDAAAVRKIVAARRPGWRPKVLSFPYSEVTPALKEVAC